MSKRCVSVLGFAILALAPVQTSGAALAEEQPWRLVFEDDFEGDALNTANWRMIADCWGGNNAERQCYTGRPENVIVRDGALVITARREKVSGNPLPEELRGASDNEKVEREYSSGKVVTKDIHAFLYGRIAVRAQLPLGQGVWPAIWMLPQNNNYGPWPHSGEIDILEAINLGATCAACIEARENRIFGTIHYSRNGKHVEQQAYTYLRSSKDAVEWHEYAIEWRAGRFIWFLDGVEFGRVSVDTGMEGDAKRGAGRVAPFDQPFYLILNLAIGGNWPEAKNDQGVGTDGFPKQMKIDYVRVYQRNPDAVRQ